MMHPLSPLARLMWIGCISWLGVGLLAALPLPPAFGQSAAQPSAIDQLLDTLASDDLLAAERAAQELAASGTARAVPRLTEMFLTSETPRLAAIALGGIGTAQATKVLASALADEELTPRRNAAQIGLLYGGEEAVQTLVVSLRAPQPAARRHSAELLGYLGAPFALNGLLRAAHQDADASVRRSAVWALSQIDSPRVRPTLTEISVRDPDSDVRGEAESALKRLSEGFQ